MANAQAYYDQISAGDCTPMKLQPQVTCPHCWERFVPENVLWVTEHIDLLGDPLLGAERQQRFLPSRYTLQGDALDAKGMACHSTACPKCHLPVPRAALETELLFISILGAPGSGKSYFLTSMIWQLRQLLPAHFRLGFTDADPESNRSLNEYEELLFLNPDGSEVVPFTDLIVPTEREGKLYDTVTFGQQTIDYPRPFMFMLQPQQGHPGGDPAGLSRLLCLYDNAGEHFQPGQDTVANPVTRHLAQSRAILFLFDPTQDPRFRAVCRGGSPGTTQRAAKLARQETILNEAVMRIRRHKGLSQGSKYDHPVVVVLSKFDEWGHLLGDDEDSDPWRAQGNMTGVDVERIESRSGRLREVMLKYSPETVTTAETFAKDVTYVAVSSLGSCVEVDPKTGLPGIRPINLRPHWVTVPLLYAISRVFPGLIPRLIRRAKPK